MVLSQPDSISDGPGRGGKYCKNDVDLRATEEYTDGEAKQRERGRVKERDAKAKGTTTSIGKIPIEVRGSRRSNPKAT